ncbi:hypothetical protein Tco_0549820, partial [Tanacetum coccineum]
ASMQHTRREFYLSLCGALSDIEHRLNAFNQVSKPTAPSVPKNSLAPEALNVLILQLWATSL